MTCRRSDSCITEQINANRIRPLAFVRGVDADGCVAFQPPSAFLASTILAQDTQTVDLTSTTSGSTVTLSANVIVSPNAGNQLQVLANGLYVPPPPSALITAVTDTQTVDLTVTAGTLSADVLISPNAGNQIQVLANGLYVPTPPSAFITAVTDTPTVDLTVAAGTLSASVIVSTNTGNQLQALANGLYVPPPPSAFITAVTDTQTVDLTVTAGTLSASVIVSTNAGNQIQVLANGLYVPPPPSAFITAVTNTQTVNLNVAGGTLSANVNVSPNVGNQLQVLANGLYVPPPPSAFISAVTNTQTVNLNVAAGTLSADVIVSPNAGNQLQVLPNGLYVPPGSVSYRDCAGNALPINASLVQCSTAAPVNMPATAVLASQNNAAAYVMPSVPCSEHANLLANLGVLNVGGTPTIVRVLRGNYASTEVLAVITLPTVIRTGNFFNGYSEVIDSFSFTNPSNCHWVLLLFDLFNVETTISHAYYDPTGTLNTNANPRIINTTSSLFIVTNLHTLYTHPNVPGLPNTPPTTPITGHQWQSATIVGRRLGFDLVAPGATANYERIYSVSSNAVDNGRYVTMRSAARITPILLRQ